MNTLDLSDYKIKDEWIVEQFTKEGVRVIGKVAMSETIHLSNENLEDIWDLANFGVSGVQEFSVTGNSPYNGMRAFKLHNLTYVPMFSDGKPVACVVNGDIFVRKHYNEGGYGYGIKAEGHHDTWVHIPQKVWLDMMKCSRYNL